MKLISICLLGLFLFSCSVTEKETAHPADSTNTTLIEPQKRELFVKKDSDEEAASAVIAVALATTIGAATKDNFQCNKECEQELKKSINKRTK